MLEILAPGAKASNTTHSSVIEVCYLEFRLRLDETAMPLELTEHGCFVRVLAMG